MKRAVSIIVLGNLFGVLMCFSANAVAGDLPRAWGMTPAQIGLLSNAVQLAFIAGTLVCAISDVGG